MAFTTKNVLALLQKYHGHPFISPENSIPYQWVSLLPDDISEMRPDILYVCMLSEGMMRNHLQPSCHFVCIADRYLNDDDLEDEKLLQNIILLEENRSISWLLSLLQNRFRELEQWEHELKDCVRNDCSYQQIFDISEHYLKNSLFALDSAYRLIAYSREYLSSDPINVKLYEKGYYTPDILEKFYAKKRLPVYSSSPGITINKPGPIAQFESFSQWCRYEGMELVQIVEVFSHSPEGPDSMELFETLMHYINICFQKEQKQGQSAVMAHSRFLKDMLYNGMTDIVQINESAKQIGIPVNGVFDAYSIRFSDINQVLVGRFINELQSVLSNVWIVANHYDISILCFHKSGNSIEGTRRNLEKIKPILEQYGAICGVSPEFPSIKDFEIAVKQAEYAINCYNSVKEMKDRPDGKDNIVFYKDFILMHLIETASVAQFDPFYNNPYIRMLNSLMQYDHENDTDLYDILFVYLTNERRSTASGEILHMHRNTVMYHIQHITEMLDVDLDDYCTRQGVLIAYHFKKNKNV